MSAVLERACHPTFHHTNPMLRLVVEGWRTDDPLGSVAAAVRWLSALPPERRPGRAVARRWVGDAAAAELLPNRPARPGVVGLVVIRHRGQEQWGAVCPLETVPKDPAASDGWHADLPENIRWQVDDLWRRAAPGDLRAVRSYQVRPRLEHGMHGDSMTLAAFLAMLDATNGGHSLFRAVAALGLVDEDGRVRPVDGEGVKLDAFVREYGRGSLLVLPKEGTAVEPRHLARFDRVWRVPTFDALLTRLRRAGVEVRFPGALAVPPAGPAGPTAEMRDAVASAQAKRAAGHWGASLDITGRLIDGLSTSPLGYTARVQLLAEHAAGLLAAGRPAEAVARLDSVYQLNLPLDDDLAVPLANTLARGLAQVPVPPDGLPSWDVLFRQSMERERTNRPGYCRSRNGLIHQLLRHQRLDEAEPLIAAGLAAPTDDTSAGYLRFYRADLARRRGRVWVDERSATADRDTVEFGYYLQAVGRQSRLPPATAVAFLDRAADAFDRLAPPAGEHSWTTLFAAAVRLRSAALRAGWDRRQRRPLTVEVGRAWAATAEEVRVWAAVATASGGPRDWDAAFDPPPRPDEVAAERLLDSIPWF